jgi:hypothetical protein
MSEHNEQEMTQPPAPKRDPVYFHALDRFHAMTYVAQHLPDEPDDVKAKVHGSLDALTHAGPVYVAIFADGEYQVTPFDFVQV